MIFVHQEYFKYKNLFFVKSKKNPLSASGQAPVASESVVALSARGPLRGVGREQALCSWAGSALRADWNLGQRSAASNLCIASRSKLVLPQFVDALLGICVFFSGNSLVCAGAVWMR
mgnify:CR=1 FL=1